jgi:2-keto-3-deoxy-L-rhamnonate aldolase RhmA
VSACKLHGKRAGLLARNADEAVQLAAAGFDCFALGSDTAIYQAALAQAIGDARARIAKAP